MLCHTTSGARHRRSSKLLLNGPIRIDHRLQRARQSSRSSVMNSGRVFIGLKAALAALAGGLLLGGGYYPYGYSAYPPYPGYGSPTVPMAYTEREFTLPPGATGASGTAAGSAPAS